MTNRTLALLCVACALACAACTGSPDQAYCDDLASNDLPLRFTARLVSTKYGVPPSDTCPQVPADFELHSNQSGACGEGCQCQVGGFNVTSSEEEYGDCHSDPTCHQVRTVYQCHFTFQRTCTGAQAVVSSELLSDLGGYALNAHYSLPDPVGGAECSYVLTASLR